MSFFTVFDWISPLLQAFQTGETMMLTPAEMTYLQQQGITVHTISAFESGGLYCVKVEQAERAERLLRGEQPKRRGLLGVFSEPADWTCGHCGSRLPHAQRKCPNCGASRR